MGGGGLTPGTVPAIQACRLRVPEGTPEEAAQLADRALQRIVDVMEGTVLGATDVLKAAALIRTEVCGPVEHRLAVRGDVSIRVVDPYAEKPE